jgi:hypothetical protein
MVLSNPNYNRWVEPVFRILAYRYAEAYGAIWYPAGDRLQTWFNKNYFIIPPVIDGKELDQFINPATPRGDFLRSKGIDPKSYIIFISGTIYAYSQEYKIFLKSVIFIKLWIQFLLTQKY